MDCDPNSNNLTTKRPPSSSNTYWTKEWISSLHLLECTNARLQNVQFEHSKTKFVAIPCSTDPEFSLRLWDRLLPQALTTLNLLRGSRINPKLSAYAQLNGAFNFNRTPMGPPGTRVLLHQLPEARGTWAPYAVPGWYIGPAFEHYQCYRVYITKTAKERIANTLV